MNPMQLSIAHFLLTNGVNSDGEIYITYKGDHDDRELKNKSLYSFILFYFKFCKRGNILSVFFDIII